MDANRWDDAPARHGTATITVPVGTVRPTQLQAALADLPDIATVATDLNRCAGSMTLQGRTVEAARQGHYRGGWVRVEPVPATLVPWLQEHLPRLAAPAGVPMEHIISVNTMVTAQAGGQGPQPVVVVEMQGGEGEAWPDRPEGMFSVTDWLERAWDAIHGSGSGSGSGDSDDELTLDETALVLQTVLRVLEWLHSQGEAFGLLSADSVYARRRDDCQKGALVRLADVHVEHCALAKCCDIRRNLRMGSSGRRAVVATPFWRAPEVLSSPELLYSGPADIWAVGVLALELFHMEPLGLDMPPVDFCRFVASGGFAAEVREHAGRLKCDVDRIKPVPEPLLDLVLRCLEQEADARPTAVQLLTHPLLKPAGRATKSARKK